MPIATWPEVAKLCICKWTCTDNGWVITEKHPNCLIAHPPDHF